MVKRAVKLEGEAVGDGGVAYVEARVTDGGEDVVVIGIGLGFRGVVELVVDGVGVDECDGEAS